MAYTVISRKGENIMSYKNFRHRVLTHLIAYKNSNFGNLPNGVYRSHEDEHILPINERLLNLMDSAGAHPINYNYHAYAHHLNSSQMICLNFFNPIKDQSDILVRLLQIQLGINFPLKTKVKESRFEYIPNGRRHTNFDFYIELTTGEKIYFEIKYTEQNFGGAANTTLYPDRYNREWNAFYGKQIANSMHFREMNQVDFYNNYQINRNIAYIKDNKDYVCFVYPFDNIGLSNKMENIDYNNVLKIDWHNMCENILSITKGTEFNKHFLDFKEKYLNY